MTRKRGLALAAFAFVAASQTTMPAQGQSEVERVRQQLIGSYKLISYDSYDEKGTVTRLPYETGQISYDAAGRMSAQLMRKDRPRFTAGQQASEAERAAAYSSYIAYFGRYEIDPARKVVTHHVEGSVSPNMVGQGMPRHYELSADRKTLFLSVKNGERVVGRLQWDKHPPLGGGR
jgi:hypothetical protein